MANPITQHQTQQQQSGLIEWFFEIKDKLWGKWWGKIIVIILGFCVIAFLIFMTYIASQSRF